MPEPDVVAAAIARNTRKLRAERQWSLERLAERSGVSKGMLVQIEQARTNPSMGTLCRVADAYGVTLAQLVELSDTASVRVVEADEVIRLWSGEEGSAGDLLVGVDRREHVELWRWTLAPGDRHDSEGHMEGTREMMAVLSGTLTLDVADQTYTVRSGAAVLFDGHRDHVYRNAHKRPLDAVLVVIQPTTGDPALPSHPG
ncbi:helix-turn-helix domain-containing protein [Iamia sp. SCSIO 61187]|uniref:helix-turn-helix domain-containing protein n=1 Tax=Iamia sp. SCSIO 61187 TaxID=2722752 RepID=UPI001C62A5A0|nr:XRE family transcriptional regulator [Iamia sp. SCSIO 61187]QYG94992.1 helix-turn-helix domain-containing protein [Iamia sp. SCSIO 61187]